MRVSIKDSPKAFLEGVALSLARTIDAGRTHNEDGVPLRDILNEVIEQIPQAPLYAISGRRGR